MRQIKVLVVEDSLLFRELLIQKLNEDPAIQVVATARDPFEARDAIIKYQPDVMTLDIELPQMSGIEFLRKLMPQYPLPAVVISSLSDKVFDALNAGAVEFVAKPSGATRAQLEAFMKNEILVKIKVASIAKVGSRKKLPVQTVSQELHNAGQNLVVAIGASTGGTEAIQTVIEQFGPDIPGVVIVQHMPPGFTEMYAKRLNERCRVRVKEAKSGDPVVPGQVLIAPGGEVEDALSACAHDHDGGTCKLLEVGGDVHGGLRAAVNAADAAGRKDLDAGHVGDDHRCGDGRCAVSAACDDCCQVAAGYLCDLASGLAEVLDLLGGEAGLESAADDGDRRGHRAVIAYRFLDQHRRFDVFRIGHAVGDDRALERYDGLAFRQRLLYFGGDVKIFIHNNAPFLFHF